jgi:hypothetical protein
MDAFQCVVYSCAVLPSFHFGDKPKERHGGEAVTEQADAASEEQVATLLQLNSTCWLCSGLGPMV